MHSGQVAIPWMMNRGLRLFGEIWEQHAPGSSLLGAAAQALLPMMDPALLVKLLNTALVLALTLQIYQLAKALSGKESAGLLAALTWAWWAPVYGNIMLYFDTLLAACVLLALLITYRGGQRAVSPAGHRHRYADGRGHAFQAARLAGARHRRHLARADG